MSEKLKKNLSSDEEVFSDDRTPFHDVLQKSELPSFIRWIESRPDKVIRVVPERRYAGHFASSYNKENINEIMAEQRRGKELFDKLRAEYHIPIPNIDIVFGEMKKDEITVFIVVDRIEGRDLSQYKNLSHEVDFGQHVDDFCANLIRYYADIYKKGGEFLFDIASPRQWMWGHRVGEAENRLWIVDVDPCFGRHDSVDPIASGSRELLNLISKIAYFVRDIRFQTDNKVACKKTREVMNRFSEVVPRSDPNHFKIENIISSLS